jgi:hypothetical protein
MQYGVSLLNIAIAQIRVSGFVYVAICKRHLLLQRGVERTELGKLAFAM